ncbi:MAG: hypothetical protein QM775_08025 [Pirellulales bacterium]
MSVEARSRSRSRTSTSAPPAASDKLPRAIVVGATFLASLAAAAWTISMPLRVDEPFHMSQIEMFLLGDFRMYVADGTVYPVLAMLPGYHLLMAGLVKAFDVRTFEGLRFVHFGLSLGLLPAAYFTALRTVGREQAWLRALQCYCCPFVFAMCFVVYTDVLSLTFTLASLAGCLAGHYALGGLLGLAGLIVRQTNIVLLALTPALAYLRTEPAARPRIGEFVLRCWAFLVAVLFLGGFFVANGGRLPLCSPKFQSVGLFGMNVVFSAELGAVVFLPWLIFAATRTWNWAKRSPKIAVGVTATMLLTALLAQVTDDRNRADLLPELLRNHALQYLTSNFIARFAFGLAAAAMVLTVVAAGFDCATLAFLVLVWLGTTLPLALVEPRYYLPIYALLVLLRPLGSRRQELWLWAYFLATALALHAAHVDSPYFL